MAFTWTILNSDTNAPIQGAGVVMNNLETGQSWMAQSGADGRAVVIPLVSPPVTHDEQYDSYVVKDGFMPYSLMNTNWGSGGTWTAYLIPNPTGTWSFVETYRGYDITTLNGRYRFTYKAPWGDMVYDLDSLAAARATIDQVIANPPKKTSDFPIIPILIGGVAAWFILLRER